MAITNGYTTLAIFKGFALPGTGTDATDDGVIEQIIESVSRYIDQATRRRFYATTATRLFDVPDGRDLWLDDDLLAVTTLTNGDGVVLTASDYKLLPYNGAPYYVIRLVQSSGLAWENDADGDSEGVISVAGSWGFSSTTPADIAEACLLISRNIYRGRSGETAGAATVTGAGVVITPRDVPPLAADILKKYTRLVL